MLRCIRRAVRAAFGPPPELARYAAAVARLEAAAAGLEAAAEYLEATDALAELVLAVTAAEVPR